MARTQIDIETRDGVCPASLFTPDAGPGPWPGVLFFMDGLGIRPALWQMAQRLADQGYVVLAPDLYYRHGPYAPRNAPEVATDPAQRAQVLAWLASLDRDRKLADGAALVDAMAAHPDVAGDRLGAVGYFMGGNVALTVAGATPGRFAAVASFHGGDLATDDPDSPHRHVGAIAGRIYVASATDDTHFPAEQRARLEDALADAGADYEIETYHGVKHGFPIPDLTTFDAEGAERHWSRITALFGETLQSHGAGRP
jgi:carboxymethylenebutenolidase